MYKFVAVLLAGLMLSSCATMHNMTTEEKVAIGLQAADVATTWYGLDHGMNEQNPIYGGDDSNDKQTLAKVVLFNVASALILHHISSKQFKQAQKHGWRIVIGIRSSVVVWNLDKIIEHDRERH